ncbi:MAG: LL-diaminopimelate aminotransferase [Paludibacteraceae bacterium]|nr:LL-diaminopimelate aminotransferase [Paludibacteraceae bacterium]
MNINQNFNKLQSNYLFTEIVNRGKAYQQAHPDTKLLKLGVGDVTLPLPAPIINAMHNAVEDLAHVETFHGYGLEEGNLFLRTAIIQNDYKPLGIQIDTDEVFISDGAGSDLGNTSELFDVNNHVAVLDPVYPAYVDTNVMAGRSGIWSNGRWSDIEYLPCTAENAFVPELPKTQADIIYLCFPNNPTGTTLTRQQLQLWVDYAIEHKSIIIFDSAYEIFIEEDDVPHSIYELPGAKQCAIEIRSYSKTAGFTSVRCGYTVVPKATGLNGMWYRRQCTKFNGASYISQRGAEATYSDVGRAGIMKNICYYKQNAELIRTGLQSIGYQVYGGVNAPYIWMKVPNDTDSWTFFDLLLDRCQVLCTPGVGFGMSGQGYVRFSAFGSRSDTQEAIQRIRRL